MPELDVDRHHLDLVRHILARHVPDREVRAFGSRVHATARPASDLDLAILGDERVPLETVAAPRLELEESPLPFAVDLVEWTAISPSFRRRIEERYVVVQKGASDSVP